MSSRPWMPFYFGDYLSKTGHLSTIEHGAYFLLIAHYWANNGLPKSSDDRRKITKISPHKWQKIERRLKKFFSLDWRHKRIDEEIERAAAVSEKRRAAAEKRYGKDHANAHAIAEQKHTHSQSHSQSHKKEDIDSSPPARRPSKKKYTVPMPEGWKPPERAYEIAREIGLAVPPIEERFRDYLKSSGKQYVDYDAAFCNFVRNQPKFNGGSNGQRHPEGGSVSKAARRLLESGFDLGEAPAYPGLAQGDRRPDLLSGTGGNPVRLLSKG